MSRMTSRESYDGTHDGIEASMVVNDTPKGADSIASSDLVVLTRKDKDDVKDRKESTNVEDLLARCRTLLAEIEALRDFVADCKKGREYALRSGSGEAVDLRQFHAPVVTELKSLQKVWLHHNVLSACHIYQSAHHYDITDPASLLDSIRVC